MLIVIGAALSLMGCDKSTPTTLKGAAGNATYTLFVDGRKAQIVFDQVAIDYKVLKHTKYEIAIKGGDRKPIVFKKNHPFTKLAESWSCANCAARKFPTLWH